MTDPVSAPVAEPVTDLLGGALWRCLATRPDAIDGPAGLPGEEGDWLAATVPGTAGGALLAAGRWDGGEPPDLDAQDWWWRTTVPAGCTGPVLLTADGLATLADVWVDGRHVLHNTGMFTGREVELPSVAPGAQVVLRCAALAPLLARPRRPRARWRSGLVTRQELRWWRTSLLGRTPGVAGTAPPVGPWRPLRLVPVPPLRISGRDLHAALVGGDGVLRLTARLAGPAVPGLLAAELEVGGSSAGLALRSDGQMVTVEGTVRLPGAAPWWPHTHGTQPLHEAVLTAGGHRLPLGRVGFRSVEADTVDGGFGLVVNGTRIFARGVCWVSPDPVGLAPSGGEILAALRQLRDAGMNVVRVVGGSCYESEEFWSLCDELGLLVWQDAMLATLDVPDEPALAAEAEAELRQTFRRAQAHPALAVVSGGNEVEQQPWLLGLDPAATTVPLAATLVPALAAELLPGIPVVTSTPGGSQPPTRPDRGTAHWFGVGAYLQPPASTRAAGIRFAAECLAFSLPPERRTVDRVFGGAAAAGHTPAWKQGVPRDRGRSWDFEDVRDHYVRLLFGVEPADVRYDDPERALDLGRAAVAEVMAGVLREWRRPGSSCDGAIVLAARDSWPGAGWGLVDATGTPKAPWWLLRQVLAPTAVLLVDEGLGGLRIHVVHDGANDLPGELEITAFARGETPVGRAVEAVVVPAHGALERDAELLLGGFRDLTHAARFGPLVTDVVAVALRSEAGELLARAVHLPGGPARAVEVDLGLTATVEQLAQGWALRLATRRLAQHVVVDLAGWLPEHSWLTLPPGAEVVLALAPVAGAATDARPAGEVRALNLARPVVVH